ncbi:PfkB family carbohydrate kinase [Prochlorococcus sp. MIT 1300]|uniref:PfkB family carbohydrate kinase n=1 Tax=Prochlorococcus sp. MIT 1300 TaxID=3096218 RepID=UPI002A75DA3A|nr:PfkB family carbohydrate kinase [Prochlorococcus sp. MIT 1300]
MSSKIIKLKDAKPIENLTLAYGHFTTIHPGHIRYLKHAKAQGNVLAVALIGDGEGESERRYQFKQKERAEALAMIEMADAVILLQDNELSQAIKILMPNLLVLGKEYENSMDKEILEATSILRGQGKTVEFHAGEIHYATTDLLSRSEKELIKDRRVKFKVACKRQNLDLNKLLNSMEAWQNSRLAVLGDTIIDQYAACEAVGMSAEAPVVVVRELEHKNFIGGAAVVASHIRALGAKCDLISVVGNDKTAEIVHADLNKRNIGNHLVTDNSRPTTFKKRYVVENQKLFRVSRLEDHLLSQDIEQQILDKLEEIAPQVNGIVISDFVYGVVTKKILEAVRSLAEKHKLLLFGDLQCSSQVGSIMRFKGFSLLCPNEREARIALQDKDTGLEILSKNLVRRTESQRLIMKLGAEGFIAYDRNSSNEMDSQAFPALCVNPLDVAGAGDSLLALMATGLASGEPMMATAAIGCCMASIAVETMGNTPIAKSVLTNNLIEVLEK